MFKYLLIIVINSYTSNNIVLEKFETKEQCETSKLEIQHFNQTLGVWNDNINFSTKCVKI